MEQRPLLTIEQLENLDDFATVVRLQSEIWGFADIELLPRRLFVVASKIGGQILGAFHADRMVAFCLCIPGLKPGGRPYLHSHMLGVLPPYRNSGVGRRLKLAQREYALANNIDLIEWTFDPLEIKNAFFNIERLGAVVRRYTHDQYGTTTSHLHGGLPTDRLTAEWWVNSPRVLTACAGPGSTERLLPGAVNATITVAADLERQRTEDPEAARQNQARISVEFDRAFGSGLTVTGFRKETAGGSYLLQQWQSN